MVPDFEPLLQKYLTSSLGDVRVCSDVPKTAPSSLVTFSRTGTWTNGSETESVDRPIVTIRAWGPTDNDVRKLSRRVRRAMFGITSQNYFTYCQQQSTYSSQGENGEPQYVATYVLVLCGDTKEE